MAKINSSIFGDETWDEGNWHEMLERFVQDGILTWKDVATLTLGHMNPSQVGTSLASSEGFKRRYGKGQVMPLVMGWFYAQDGRCQDCGSRLELQADHIKPREAYADGLDADFIENMTLRCRRCNVIRRPSHEFGGKTHLTAEAALMWILHTFRPRTQLDFIRMCRLYGMTMADVRMQEGWAMAHWLNRLGDAVYALDADNKASTLLLWPDGAVTRMWDGDTVPKLEEADVIAKGIPADLHIAILFTSNSPATATTRVQLLRNRVGMLPFSHYFPDRDAQALAIHYTPPKRRKAESLPEGVEREVATDEGAELEEAEETAEEVLDEVLNPDGPGGQSTTIRPLPPRGFSVLGTVLLRPEQTASVTWQAKRGSKSLIMPASTRNKNTKKVCDMTTNEVGEANFTLSAL